MICVELTGATKKNNNRNVPEELMTSAENMQVGPFYKPCMFVSTDCDTSCFPIVRSRKDSVLFSFISSAQRALLIDSAKIELT